MGFELSHLSPKVNYCGFNNRLKLSSVCFSFCCFVSCEKVRSLRKKVCFQQKTASADSWHVLDLLVDLEHEFLSVMLSRGRFFQAKAAYFTAKEHIDSVESARAALSTLENNHLEVGNNVRVIIIALQTLWSFMNVLC